MPSPTPAATISRTVLPPPSPSDRMKLAVCGAHLESFPLHSQLLERDSVLVKQTTSSPHYKLFALPTSPPKPGMIRCEPEHSVGAGSDPVSTKQEKEVDKEGEKEGSSIAVIL